MNVTAITSDGQYTIGTDELGRVGQWSGNMTATVDARDFMPARAGDRWSDGNDEWVVLQAQDGGLEWIEIVEEMGIQ